MKKRDAKKHWIIVFYGLSVMILFGLCWGCAAPSTAPPRSIDHPADISKSTPQAPEDSQARTVDPPSEGSLWHDQGMLSHMFINPKAKNVGDIVTIKIVETSSATNKASTETGRTSTLTAGLDRFFNAEKRFPSDQPFFNPFTGVNTSFENDFDGSGTTKRSGALTAFMTARIVEIMPNGNLLIEGNREVRVNNENQVITLTGLVRSRDITADNVVQSTYIADARITYSGNGVLDDKQQPGWFIRIMDKVWPF